MPTQMNKDKSTHENLVAANFVAEQSMAVRKMLSTKEKGKKYLLELSENSLSVVYQVDNYIIKDRQKSKCDKLVLVQPDAAVDRWVEVFVELKGTDAVHGMEQLLGTAQEALFQSRTNEKVLARLVSTSVPSNNANKKVEQLKREFAKKGIDYRRLKPQMKDKI